MQQAAVHFSMLYFIVLFRNTWCNTGRLRTRYSLQSMVRHVHRKNGFGCLTKASKFYKHFAFLFRLQSQKTARVVSRSTVVRTRLQCNFFQILLGRFFTETDDTPTYNNDYGNNVTYIYHICGIILLLWYNVLEPAATIRASCDRAETLPEVPGVA